MMNISTCVWDEELLCFFNLESSKLQLPKIIPNDMGSFRSTLRIATTSGLDDVWCHKSIDALIGDQQAALYGHGCLELGSMKMTYGVFSWKISLEVEIFRHRGFLTC